MHDSKNPEWPPLNLARSVHDPEQEPWVTGFTDDYGNIEAERYLPVQAIRERLEMKAWAFGKEADASEAQQEIAKTAAEMRLWQGKALAWSAASAELRRLANSLAAFPEQSEQKEGER